MTYLFASMTTRKLKQNQNKAVTYLYFSHTLPPHLPTTILKESPSKQDQSIPDNQLIFSTFSLTLTIIKTHDPASCFSMCYLKSQVII